MCYRLLYTEESSSEPFVVEPLVTIVFFHESATVIIRHLSIYFLIIISTPYREKMAECYLQSSRTLKTNINGFFYERVTLESFYYIEINLLNVTQRLQRLQSEKNM